MSSIDGETRQEREDTQQSARVGRITFAPPTQKPYRIGEPFANIEMSSIPQPSRVMRYDVEKWFTYQITSNVQKCHMVAIRERAKELAFLLLDLVPAGPDQTAAIRKLRECVWTAIASIAADGGDL